MEKAGDINSAQVMATPHIDERPAQAEAPAAAVASAPRWLARVAAPSGALPLIAVLGVLLFVINLGGYPFYTKGEPREAVTVFDIVHGGRISSWILPMRAGVEIPSKPLMMHWLAALLSIAAGKVDEWTVRLPSAALAVAGMIICYLYVRRLFDQLTALLSALILGSSIQYLQAGSGARVDMTLTFFMEVALFEFLLIAEGLTARRTLLYVALAAAVLAKGPVGLVLPAAVAAIWIVIERRFGLLHRLNLARGAAIVGGVAGGWYLAATAVGGMAFIRKQILAENIFTFFYSKELSGGHAHPFYYVELALLAGFLPWTFLIPSAIAQFFAKPETISPRTRYLIVWFLTVLIFYNLAHSKRGVYLLALYPALATAVALFLSEIFSRTGESPRWVRACSSAAGALWLLSGAAALLALTALWLRPSALGDLLGLLRVKSTGFLPALEAATGAHSLVAVLIAAAAALAGSWLLRAKASAPKMVAGIVAGMVCLVLAANLFVVPAMAFTQSLKGFTREAMRTVGGKPVAYLVALNYDVAFYSGRSIPVVYSFNDAPEYLLMLSEPYGRLPAETRRQWTIVLQSGPTELDGSGGMMLLRRSSEGAL